MSGPMGRRLMLRRTAAGLLQALLLSSLVPKDIQAQTARPAGHIALVVPIVNLERGARVMDAVAHMPVQWGDAVNTGRLARARVALEDGSVLNVGSDSVLKITQHDPAAQQTDLELSYGRLRSQAVKLTKPGAHFTVRTPTGIAGVVGTDFFLAYENFTTRLIVFEGRVHFCNLASQCVDVPAGAASSVLLHGAPAAPRPATPSDLTDAGRSTSMPAKLESAAALGAHPALTSFLLGTAIFLPLILVRTLSPDCGCSHGIIYPGSSAARGSASRRP